MTTPTEVEVDVRQLGALRKIGTGGQGTVFELADGPKALVYKEYSPRVANDVQVPVLRRFVTFLRELDEPTRQNLTARAAWPVNVVRRDGVVSGFVMPRAPREFTVELDWTTGRDSVLAQAQYLLNDRRYLRDRGLYVDDGFRLEFLRDTAETLALFHRLGIVVGDLSPANLLFSQRIRPRCFFIDCDAMRLGDDSVLAAVETPDWRVEDLDGDEELATTASDCYKLGLLALRIFAGDQHERDPAKVPALPARARIVVTSSLRVDPAERPAVDAWLRPLDTALRSANRRGAARRLAGRMPWVRLARPRLPRSAPRPRPQRPRSTIRRRQPAVWLLMFLPVIIGVIIGLANRGGGSASGGVDNFPAIQFTAPVTVPHYEYTPIIRPQLTVPFPYLVTPLLPSVSPCELVLHPAPSTALEKAVQPALDSYQCGLNADDYTAAGGPNDTRSRGNFDALVANSGHSTAFDVTITGAVALNAVTVRANTTISASGTKCWTTTFVLDKDTAGDYTISSIGPPLAARCG